MKVAGLAKVDRDRLARTHRLVHTELPNGAQIRDQRPMPPSALGRCLHGMELADWYATINARVFFWLDPDRLNRQKAACEPRLQVVLAVDMASLIAAHEDHVSVTPINTGNARRKAALRGRATFVPWSEWVRTGWASEARALEIPVRKQNHRPVELTALDAVPDILRFVIDVVPLPTGQPFRPVAKP